MKRIIVYSCLMLAVILSSCEKEVKPTCSDSIKNQTETDVDCGGSCEPCPTCTDGKQNGNELGVDCGGECNDCPTCGDGVKNQNETGIDCGGICESCAATTCTTPLGYGQNAFLLTNGTASFVGQNVTMSTNAVEGVKLELELYFPLPPSSLCECFGYIIDFYGTSFLNMPANNVQLFKTGYFFGSGYRSSNCTVKVDRGNKYIADDDQNIYVTRLDANTYNLKFCNIKTAGSEHCPIKNEFSANVNFTVNP